VLQCSAQHVPGELGICALSAATAAALLTDKLLFTKLTETNDKRYGNLQPGTLSEFLDGLPATTASTHTRLQNDSHSPPPQAHSQPCFPPPNPTCQLCCPCVWQQLQPPSPPSHDPQLFHCTATF
jgi:hypothetical protein